MLKLSSEPGSEKEEPAIAELHSLLNTRLTNYGHGINGTFHLMASHKTNQRYGVYPAAVMEGLRP